MANTHFHTEKEITLNLSIKVNFTLVSGYGVDKEFLQKYSEEEINEIKQTLLEHFIKEINNANIQQLETESGLYISGDVKNVINL